MSGCQHCGQGAISRDVNGPVCPDCWDEGYYETANHMTDETEMPERIWATGWGLPAQEESGTFVAVGNKYPTAPNADASAYIRKDLSDAKDKRIDELETKLATATDGLRECEEEIDGYIRQEYPHDHPVQARYRARDFAANPARTTLAQIKGGMS